MGWDLDEKPLLVFWETTRACDLACKHCRAEAIPEPLPGELLHEEGLALIDQIVSFGKPYPILILTGGDVLKRRCLFDLISYARRKEIHVSVAPSVTPLLTEATINRFVAAGVEAMSLSLDVSKRTHDELRGVDGTFDRTLAMARYAVSTGLTVQINTTVMQNNLLELPALFRAIYDIGVNIWEVFFLIRTGRGSEQAEPTPDECESVCQFLYSASQYGIIARTVEAPFFRRVAAEQSGETPPEINGLASALITDLRNLMGQPTHPPHARSANTRDGRGIVFVAHNGEVTPSGFLPVSVGNVRHCPLMLCYQEAPLMRRLRESEGLGGRCGFCSYREICGGSRARAYATFGEVMAEDPSCAFIPEQTEGCCLPDYGSNNCKR